MNFVNETKLVRHINGHHKMIRNISCIEFKKPTAHTGWYWTDMRSEILLTAYSYSLSQQSWSPSQHIPGDRETGKVGF